MLIKRSRWRRWMMRMRMRMKLKLYQIDVVVSILRSVLLVIIEVDGDEDIAFGKVVAHHVVVNRT